jgi:hypothetical protein
MDVHLASLDESQCFYDPDIGITLGKRSFRAKVSREKKWLPKVMRVQGKHRSDLRLVDPGSV